MELFDAEEDKNRKLVKYDIPNVWILKIQIIYCLMLMKVVSL